MEAGSAWLGLEPLAANYLACADTSPGCVSPTPEPGLARELGLQHCWAPVLYTCLPVLALVHLDHFGQQHLRKESRQLLINIEQCKSSKKAKQLKGGRLQEKAWRQNRRPFIYFVQLLKVLIDSGPEAVEQVFGDRLQQIQRISDLERKNLVVERCTFEPEIMGSKPADSFFIRFCCTELSCRPKTV